jgi:DNA primase
MENATSRYGTFVANNLDVRSLQGDEAICLCLFHPDRNPSMAVNIRKGVFCCRSCGTGGKIDKLARKLGVELEDESVPLSALRKRCVELRKVPADEIPIQVLPESWLKQFDFPHPYWESRGLSEKIIKAFQLGYDPLTNRATIPLRDSHGKLLGVIYRKLDGTRPKYLDPKGFRKGKSLFASWKVRNSHKRIAVVEGPLDAIACWDAKVPAVALMGARMTEDQAKLMRSLGVRTVVVMADNDPSGFDATVSVKEALPGINVQVGWYRPGWRAKDPAQLKEQRRRQMYLSPMPYAKWVASFGE